ncbi:MAG: hypothetical protein Q8N51_11835 [Gammaproteobacteria bacterium]|nr:hypothetical protein [Gammaproteobacteria bacterium]
MSSEYSIHLGDKEIKGRVADLGKLSGFMVTVEVEAVGNAGAGVRLFLSPERALEASLLFHKIAQDLAALLPDDSDTDARCQGCGGLLIHNTGCPDAIPIDNVREAVEPPHRWG